MQGFVDCLINVEVACSEQVVVLAAAKLVQTRFVSVESLPLPRSLNLFYCHIKLGNLNEIWFYKICLFLNRNFLCQDSRKNIQNIYK